jgi:signal transduction histidine kinase
MTEQTLIDAKNIAEQADKLKSMFLANISHEIRTPMNSIVGFSELLSDTEVTQADRSEYINIIQKNCETLLNLIDNLLDISQIEAGQMSLTFSNCKINQMLDDLYANFSVLKEKQGKSMITLRLRKHIEDSNFSINSDNYRLQQIIMNLLGNALKFTNQGYIEFGYIVDYHNSKIKFYVKDTGLGIPEDKLDIIFDRFGKVEHKGDERHKGSGLGLAISKNLAELLGGKIYVKSKYGEGSSFYFELNL